MRDLQSLKAYNRQWEKDEVKRRLEKESFNWQKRILFENSKNKNLSGVKVERKAISSPVGIINPQSF